MVQQRICDDPSLLSSLRPIGGGRPTGCEDIFLGRATDAINTMQALVQRLHQRMKLVLIDEVLLELQGALGFWNWRLQLNFHRMKSAASRQKDQQARVYGGAHGVGSMTYALTIA